MMNATLAKKFMMTLLLFAVFMETVQAMDDEESEKYDYYESDDDDFQDFDVDEQKKFFQDFDDDEQKKLDQFLLEKYGFEAFLPEGEKKKINDLEEKMLREKYGFLWDKFGFKPNFLTLEDKKTPKKRSMNNVLEFNKTIDFAAYGTQIRGQITFESKQVSLIFYPGVYVLAGQWEIFGDYEKRRIEESVEGLNNKMKETKELYIKEVHQIHEFWDYYGDTGFYLLLSDGTIFPLGNVTPLALPTELKEKNVNVTQMCVAKYRSDDRLQAGAALLRTGELIFWTNRGKWPWKKTRVHGIHHLATDAVDPNTIEDLDKKFVTTTVKQIVESRNFFYVFFNDNTFHIVGKDNVYTGKWNYKGEQVLLLPSPSLLRLDPEDGKIKIIPLYANNDTP